MPNLVQISQETAEECWQEKKKANRHKIIILLIFAKRAIQQNDADYNVRCH